MTDEQIIKALECCIAHENCEEVSCEFCPYERDLNCTGVMMQNAIDLINRQKAEIESLKQIIDEEDNEILELQKRIIFWREDLNYQPEKIKSAAIKEFAERLKNNTFLAKEKNSVEHTIWIYEIDKIVKEITEVQG